jgi:16S rRNA (guanine527-N7)-methyltransferase
LNLEQKRTLNKILHYFPSLSKSQIGQFEAIKDLYVSWNEKINVVSRKDIDEIYLHHVLHSLAIAKLITFKPGTSVLDIGTGGGFPGIPLAIFFPDVHFHLVDSIGKKITVVQEVAKSLGLKNVVAEKARA